MLFPSMTSSSTSQEPIEVDETEQEEIKEEGHDSLKALSCIDRVRDLTFLWCICVGFLRLLVTLYSKIRSFVSFLSENDHKNNHG